MGSEHRSAISVVFVLLLAGTMTAVAVAPAPAAQPAQQPTSQSARAADGTANATASPTITVSETGTVQGEPDLAILHLESTATAADPQTASDRLAANASALRTAFLNANVTEDAIRTTEYNLYDASDRESPRTGNETSRYRAQQTTAVEVSNTSRVGELIDVAVANGASGVRGVQFTLSEERRSELRNRALEDAMGSARTQAETLAAAEDLRVTGVGSISADAGGPQPFVARETAAAADSGTRIDGGPVSVEATVEVTYNATA